MTRAALVLVATLAAVACFPTFRSRGPGASVEVLSGHSLVERDPTRTDDLLDEADALFAQRPDLEAVREAEARYLEAAATDPTRPEGLAGATRAIVWRVEHEKDAGLREALATRAVQVAQGCPPRAPTSALCDYWLAIALGVQARERPTTGKTGVEAMVAALRRAIERNPGLDHGGPHRVLALVLLRAPGWPLGPGDDEAALAEARTAFEIDPSYPPNVAAWAEALGKNGAKAESRFAWEHALSLAEAAIREGHPDADEWAAEARRGLGRSGVGAAPGIRSR